jgi:hypothetical protein
MYRVHIWGVNRGLGLPKCRAKPRKWVSAGKMDGTEIGDFDDSICADEEIVWFEILEGENVGRGGWSTRWRIQLR